MESVKQVTVELAGLTMDDIVSVPGFCSDLKYYETFNGVYKTYFTSIIRRARLSRAKLLRNAKISK